MINEIKNVEDRNMIKSDLYDVISEIAETYAKAYAKTLEVDDLQYDYMADVLSVESIFDEIIDFIYRDYEGISTRILNKRMAEYNRIRDHYTDKAHISYKF